MNIFIKFHHFMKKNRYSWRLNNSSKTFLNQWESKGIRNLRNLSNSSSTLLYEILSSTANKFTLLWSVATSFHPAPPPPAPQVREAYSHKFIRFEKFMQIYKRNILRKSHSRNNTLTNNRIAFIVPDKFSENS